jgi:hypothetical protein
LFDILIRVAHPTRRTCRGESPATPIYRYESAAQGVGDGALFAFTKGTDSDAFLLIEARGKKDDVEWQFAFARFNGSCALRADLKNKEVWQVDSFPTRRSRARSSRISISGSERWGCDEQRRCASEHWGAYCGVMRRIDRRRRA